MENPPSDEDPFLSIITGAEEYASDTEITNLIGLAEGLLKDAACELLHEIAYDYKQGEGTIRLAKVEAKDAEGVSRGVRVAFMLSADQDEEMLMFEYDQAEDRLTRPLHGSKRSIKESGAIAEDMVKYVVDNRESLTDDEVEFFKAMHTLTQALQGKDSEYSCEAVSMCSVVGAVIDGFETDATRISDTGAVLEDGRSIRLIGCENIFESEPNGSTPEDFDSSMHLRLQIDVTYPNTQITECFLQYADGSVYLETIDPKNEDEELN